MAQGDKPTHELYAVIPPKKGVDKANWIRLASGFTNSDGSLGFTLDTVPLAWFSVDHRAKLVIRKRQTDETQGTTRRGS